ncbi:hypothetical protein SG34_017360 [Thalassomonas viridans]|uniref:Uncharacterized protein n=1 Tax=Thalassomonas viridans TaxID=137584 RepID=A0AAE9YXR4_9GAMM|nr:hypothetical protein [Thalassomonas viridans]WDE03176.1 hypothetical protein SG34_017360 [Thalassomonas viridans]
MVNSNEFRFNEALETLLHLGSNDNADLYKAYHGVLQWLDHQGNRHQAMAVIGERIALSAYVHLQDGLEQDYCKLVQALLLLLATRHNKSVAELEQTGRRLCLGKRQTDLVMLELADNCDDIQMSAGYH